MIHVGLDNRKAGRTRPVRGVIELRYLEAVLREVGSDRLVSVLFEVDRHPAGPAAAFQDAATYDPLIP